ncbi:MAG: hypothetical protein GQ559_04580 [Desulfobulbaceae bacterium]|nr:hypothetical protein [Desulfobulbaceae bacterium]
MNTRERRSCHRYPLNYPVLLNTSYKEGDAEGHLAEIIDAGVNGMRLLVTTSNALQVGRELIVFCLPAEERTGSTWRAIELRCRVVWKNGDNHEVGLHYIQ